MVQVHNEQDPIRLNVSNSSPQQQGPNVQQQESTVVQMDTSHPPSLGSQTTEQKMTGNIHPDIAGENQAIRPIAQEGSSARVGGVQSLETQGGVNSVANETALTTRTPGASSSYVSEPKDSTLERLNCAQYFAGEKLSSMPQRSLDSSSLSTEGFQARSHIDRSLLESLQRTSLRDSLGAYSENLRFSSTGNRRGVTLHSLSFNASRKVSGLESGPRDFGEPYQESSPKCPIDASCRDIPNQLGIKPSISYTDLLKEVLQLVNLPDLLVHGSPPSSSPWDLLLDDPQSNQSVALAFDDHMLAVLLDAFKAPEPRIKLVEQSSLFKVPQAIYRSMLFQSPTFG